VIFSPGARLGAISQVRACASQARSLSVVKIKQYVYFGIASEVMTAESIAGRIGLAPDKALVRGSPSQNPLRPVRHKWELGSYEPGRDISEHVAAVLARLEPARDGIRTLVREGEVQAWLQLVRYFDAADGEEEVIDETPEGLVKLSGQHQLLGWHLHRDALAFLDHVGAEIDADEYG
jgi:Domain of unknown function (DUF4279)